MTASWERTTQAVRSGTGARGVLLAPNPASTRRDAAATTPAREQALVLEIGL